MAKMVFLISGKRWTSPWTGLGKFAVNLEKI